MTLMKVAAKFLCNAYIYLYVYVASNVGANNFAYTHICVYVFAFACCKVICNWFLKPDYRCRHLKVGHSLWICKINRYANYPFGLHSRQQYVRKSMVHCVVVNLAIYVCVMEYEGRKLKFWFKKLKAIPRYLPESRGLFPFKRWKNCFKSPVWTLFFNGILENLEHYVAKPTQDSFFFVHMPARKMPSLEKWRSELGRSSKGSFM